MKIVSLSIENFRSIDKVSCKDLGDAIIVAGPNGCGKSSIFDAVRFIKSVYGGYQQNEVDQWFNELQIDPAKFQGESKRLFRDDQKPVEIKVDISLSSNEKQFIRDNIEGLLRPLLWNRSTSALERYGAIATQLRTAGREVNELLKEESAEILKLLSNDLFSAHVTINPGGKITTSENRVLEMIFSSYIPNNIGIIDYHGPNRNYARERIGGINLSIESQEQKMSQHALYNYVNKYSNIKSEMAAAYVRSLISREAGIKTADDSLINTLKELFNVFFPGKTFLGPQPGKNGELSFPVRLASGKVHDIDELSSGEKEILYGYLRIRNTTPHNSVLLLDEPELHLNPRLVQGLPQFYQKYLGKALTNQIWLTTHSDAFLRETVGLQGFAVYHMESAEELGKKTENQLHEVRISDDLQKAVFDLIGDLAAYHPGAKVVLFEGGGDSEFDVAMTSKLFPRFRDSVNPISCGNKSQVQNLHEKLEEISTKSKLPFTFFSIVDSDTDRFSRKNAQKHKWNVYHIENYLLEEKFILEVLKDLDTSNKSNVDFNQVSEMLLECARESVDELVDYELRKWIDNSFITKIKITDDIFNSIIQSKNKIVEAVSTDLTKEKIDAKKSETKERYLKTFSSGNWKKELRGRTILKRFVGKYGFGASYDTFKSLIISKMSLQNFEPAGMKVVIDKILK